MEKKHAVDENNSDDVQKPSITESPGSCNFDGENTYLDLDILSTIEQKKLERIYRRARTGMHESKIFIIDGSALYALSNVLFKRGWVQKLTMTQMERFKEMPLELLLAHSETNNVYEKVLITQYLHRKLPNFLWTHKIFNRKQYDSSRLYSKIVRGGPYNFARKTDLLNIYNDIHWFLLADKNYQIPPVHVRGYAITDEESRQPFIDDFNLTICTSFIYYLSRLPSVAYAFSSEAQLTIDSLEFAMEKVRKAIENKKHEDIDEDLDEVKDFIGDFEIPKIVLQYIVDVRTKMKYCHRKKPLAEFVAEIEELNKQLLEHYPNVQIDGFHNIWIVKPAHANCGAGIHIMNNLVDILKFLDEHKATVYVVQKYIENPLLIYNTKFDIRQYFAVVMETKAVNIWMYKNCYLKLSGQEYNLDDLRECIHVTNHTVQKKYENGRRNDNLPAHNMWVLSEFKDYLKIIGKETVWDDQIYPGMTNIIKTVVNASLDETIVERNNFELYGADFMISEFFDPVLLEINSSPDLTPSTVSTKTICPAVLEDLVKVLLDYPKDVDASTGDFELVWRKTIPSLEGSNCDLEIQGAVIRTPKNQEQNYKI